MDENTLDNIKKYALEKLKNMQQQREQAEMGLKQQLARADEIIKPSEMGPKLPEEATPQEQAYNERVLGMVTAGIAKPTSKLIGVADKPAQYASEGISKKPIWQLLKEVQQKNRMIKK